MHPRSILTRTVTAAVLSAMLVVPAQAFSLDSFLGKTEESKQAVSENPLTQLLTQQLNVSEKQAAGGAGALLALARSSLSSEQTSELTSLIPGMDKLTGAIPGSLGNMLNSMDTVNNIFNMLGLDPAMVSQFAPILLSFLGEQGASESLLSSLTKAWQ